MNVPSNGSTRELGASAETAMAASPAAAAATPTGLGSVDAARARGRRIELICVACLLLGWFGLAAVVTDLGDFSVRLEFYQLWSVLEHPARLFTGLQSGDGAQSFAFGVICVAAVLAVFLPYRLPHPAAWLGQLAPLALMLTCGVVLYRESRAELLADAGQYGAAGSQILHWANSLADRLSGMATRRTTAGLGAYLSGLASLVLAARGLSRYRRAARS